MQRRRLDPGRRGRPGGVGNRAISGRQRGGHVGARGQAGLRFPACRLADHRHSPVVERVVRRHQKRVTVDTDPHQHVLDSQLGRDHAFDQRGNRGNGGVPEGNGQLVRDRRHEVTLPHEAFSRQDLGQRHSGVNLLA